MIISNIGVAFENGSSIPIWNTPWLQNENNVRIITPTIIYDELPDVSSLIDHNLGCWNIR